MAMAPPEAIMPMRDIVSTPPPMARSFWPEITSAAARFTASRPEAQKRLICTPGTFSPRPAWSAAARAMSPPASPTGSTQPRITSSTAFWGSELRSATERSAWLASARAVTSCRAPSGLPRPRGVRTVSKIKASLIGASKDANGEWRMANGFGRNGRASFHSLFAIRHSRSSLSKRLRLERHDAVGAGGDAGQPHGRLRQDLLREEAGGDELDLGALLARLLQRHLRHPSPHIADRDQAEEVEIVGRAGAGIVGLGDGVLHEPHRRLLEMAKRRFEGCGDGVCGVRLLEEA